MIRTLFKKLVLVGPPTGRYDLFKKEQVEVELAASGGCANLLFLLLLAYVCNLAGRSGPREKEMDEVSIV